MLRILVILSLFLSGCAGSRTGSVKIGDKELIKFEMDTEGSMTWEKDGIKASYDTKKTNWWQENVMPMITGAVSAASRGR